MKHSIIILSLLSALLIISCKTGSKNSSGTTPSADITYGTVSHQYRADGCQTVILVKPEGGDELLTLIPSEPIPVKLDKDGLKVAFSYRLLRMPNPEGCKTGIPAEISDIRRD